MYGKCEQGQMHVQLGRLELWTWLQKRVMGAKILGKLINSKGRAWHGSVQVGELLA